MLTLLTGCSCSIRDPDIRTTFFRIIRITITDIILVVITEMTTTATMMMMVAMVTTVMTSA